MANSKSGPPPLPPRAISSPPPPYSVLPDGEVGIADRTITLIDSESARATPPVLPPREESMLSASSNSNAEGPGPISTGRDRSVSPGSMTDGSNEIPRRRKATIHLTPDAARRSRSSSRSPYIANPMSHEGTDPRTSSMQSLLPVESSAGTRRTLLLVYVHGFVGNDTSFGSFPAHVHNHLVPFLAESHVVHTKIYPRYKSRKNISYARDDFSNWLYPHENPSTDVVLIGHSLGGILTAEVVLLPSHEPGSHNLFQHRILGTIAFDTPFLGMHPSVVGTGIASLFKSTPKPPDAANSSTSQLGGSPAGSNTQVNNAASSTSLSSDPFSIPSEDPYYNPAFPNDVVLPQRAGKLENFMYFWNKHCGEMTKAMSSYVTSHLEFGGCLADYAGLHRRYSALRGLEDIDPTTDPKDPQGRTIPRVRFTNYYSASTGRVKEKSRPGSVSHQRSESINSQSDVGLGHQASPRVSVAHSGSIEASSRNPSVVPLMSTERLSSDGPQTNTSETPSKLVSTSRASSQLCSGVEAVSLNDEDHTATEMTHLDPEQHIVDEDPDTLHKTETDDVNDLPSIPPIGDPPTKPQEQDYEEKEFFKAALSVYSRNLKEFEKEKKIHEKAVKAREKMIKADRKATDKATSKQGKERAKAEKELLKAEQKAAKAERKQQITEEKLGLKRRATLNQETYDKALQRDAEEQGVAADRVQNKKRDRKFCALPSKNRKTGERDSTWVRVYMEGVNEIEAHTSMFVMSETYAKLVGDTAQRIETWVREAGLAGKEMHGMRK